MTNELLFRPVIVMFYNYVAKTWHPGLFEERPLLGGDRSVMRHRCSGHCIIGFGTWTEAQNAILSELAPELRQTSMVIVRVYPDWVILWDGKGIPATVILNDFCKEDYQKARQVKKKIDNDLHLIGY